MSIFSFLNKCIWLPVSGGTGSFVVSTAAQNGYTPAQCLDPLVVDGGLYHYSATNGTDHEEGDGVYTAATTTLTRTTIRNSSNSGSVVSFSSPPIVFMGGPIAGDMPAVIAVNNNVGLYVATYGSDSNTGTSLGTAATNATTSTSSPTLHFASVPSFVVANQMVWDSTTNQYVGEVLSTGAGTVTLVANAANAVGSGDTLVFANPLLTIQHAVNVAAGYDYQNLYAPTISTASGTYANTQVSLAFLTNCPAGGTITGDLTTWANVVINDGGTDYTFKINPFTNWFIHGASLRGTYGAFSNGNSTSVINIDKIDFSGNFSNFTLNPDGGAISGFGNSFTISAAGATSGQGFIFARALAGFDNATFVFSNSTTYSFCVFAGDFTQAFFAMNGATFTNGSNVHMAGGATSLVLSNGAYWESDANCKVDGTQLGRSNFPGGTNIYLDVWSTFNPDQFSVYGTLGTTAGKIGLTDQAGVLLADYGYTNSGSWSFLGAAGIQAAGNNQFFWINTSDPTGIPALGGGGSLNSQYLVLQDYISGHHSYSWNVSSGDMRQLSGAVLGWSSNATDVTAAANDTGLSRYIAGIIEVNQGTKGINNAIVDAEQFCIQSATQTATSGSGAQTWFPSNAVSTIALQGNTTYEFEGDLYLANGSTTHTTAILFALTNSLSLTSIKYSFWIASVAENTAGVNALAGTVNQATSTVLNATSTAVGCHIHIRGRMAVNHAGSLGPQFQWSASPTGTNQVLIGTRFRIWPIGAGNVVSVGAWS